MKYKKTIFSLLAFSIFFILLNYVSALAQWAQYGNDYTPNSQAQYNIYNSYFNQTSVNSFSLNKGVNLNDSYIPYQPLVSLIDTSGKQYIVFPNKTTIEIYLGNGTNVLSFPTGATAVGQFALNDFDGDGYNNDILGWWMTNSTSMSFRDYKINSTNQSALTVNLIDDLNYTDSSPHSTVGVRCQAQHCYSLNYDYNSGTGNYTLSFIDSYMGGYVSTQPVPMINRPLEPLSFIDVNNDGQNEFLAFSKSDVLVFQANANTIFHKYFIQDGNPTIINSKFTHPTASVYWDLAVSRYIPTSAFSSIPCGSNNECSEIEDYKMQDNSLRWSTVTTGCSGGALCRDYGFAVADYNGDVLDDIFSVSSTKIFFAGNWINTYNYYKVLNGETGATLNSSTQTFLNLGDLSSNNQVLIAKMTQDSHYNFISSIAGNLYIVSPYTNTMIYQRNSTGNGCAIADTNVDGSLEVVCSTPSTSTILYSASQNTNAIINSVSFNPSTAIDAGNYVNVTTTASDANSDTIFYSTKCSNDETWQNETGSPFSSCYYSTIGIYNLTVGVRDFYHPNYNTFSQDITVYPANYSVCNNNGICDGVETYYNCPSDCPLNPNQTQLNDGSTVNYVSIPTDLVTSDNSGGLLPEIYYGILGFIGYTFVPFLVFAILILVTLFMLLIARMFKKIAHAI